MNFRRLFPKVLMCLCITVLIVKFGSFRAITTYLFVDNSVTFLGNCTNISMAQLRIFGEQNRFPNGIPRIVHYNYKSKLVPSQYMSLVADCLLLNPNVKFVFWSDASSFNLMKDHFPDKFATYQSYLRSDADPLKKSDVIRYFILLYFGGVYMDLDTRCQRPLEEAFTTDSCLLSREAEVQSRIRWNSRFLAMNSFMACVYNHTFFRFVVDSLQQDDNSDILSKTGPLFLTRMLGIYNDTSVALSSSDTFSPHIERFLESFCRNPVGEWVKKGCKDLPAYRLQEKKLVNGAVVVHLFYHLGYKFARHLIVGSSHMCSLSRVHIID